MNSVVLIGRLVKDVELRASSNSSVARFTLAVDRRFKQDNQPTADFIPCVTFGKTAEFVNKYFKKGNRLAVTGRIQTGSYEKDGAKVYTTDVIVDTAEFVESKGDTIPAEDPQKKSSPTPPNFDAADEGFMQVADDLEDEGLPFR